MRPLRQVYRRVGLTSYRYDAPELGFGAELECDDSGVIQAYGDLWAASPDPRNQLRS